MKFNKDSLKNYKNSLYYFGGSILQMFISFFTQPIFSKHLSAEDFGIISYYSAIEGALNPLILLGLPQIFLMNFYRNDQETNAKDLYNSLVIQTILGFFLAVISIIALWYAYAYFDVSVDFSPYIYLAVIVIYFNNYKSFYLLRLRVEKKGYKFMMISIQPVIVSTITGYFFVVTMQMGAAGRMLGTALGGLYTGIVSIWVLRNHVIRKFEWSFFKANISRMITLTLAAYAFFPIRNIDKIFLERLDNLGELGYFGIGSRIAALFFMAGNALHSAFEPDFYKAVSNANKKRLIKLIVMYTATLIIGIIIFMLISEYVVDFFTAGRYTRAYIYANYLVVGTFFMLMFGIVNTIITAQKKIKNLLFVNILGGISAVIAHYYLIRTWGFMGGCYAKIVTGILLTIIAMMFLFYHSNKKKNEAGNN